MINARTASGSNAVKLEVATVKALTSPLAADADKAESNPNALHDAVAAVAV